MQSKRWSKEPIVNEKAAKTFITICGIGMALVPLLIGAFLFVKGTDTFFHFRPQRNGISLFRSMETERYGRRRRSSWGCYVLGRFTGYVSAGTSYFLALQPGLVNLYD